MERPARPMRAANQRPQWRRPYYEDVLRLSWRCYGRSACRWDAASAELRDIHLEHLDGRRWQARDNCGCERQPDIVHLWRYRAQSPHPVELSVADRGRTKLLYRLRS